jgi:hypothetical protein
MYQVDFLHSQTTNEEAKWTMDTPIEDENGSEPNTVLV